MAFLNLDQKPEGFAIVWSTIAIDQIGFGIFIPVLALYAQDFGASPLTIGLLSATWAAAQMVTAPIGGRLSDRIGRKPVLLFSLAGTAIGSFIAGFAGSLTLLFVGRLIDGMSGASVSVAQASVTDVAKPQERAQLLGLLGAAFGIGFSAGPAIGGLSALVSPRAPFFAAGILATVNLLVAWKRLPETHTERGGDDAPKRHIIPRINRKVWGNDAVRILGVTLFAGTAFAAFTTVVPLLYEARVGLGERGLGVVFTVVGLGILFMSSQAVQPAVSRFGEALTGSIGIASNTIGFTLLIGSFGWTGLVVGTFFLVIGQSLFNGPTSSLLVSKTPPQLRGEVLGVNQSANSLSRVLGPIAGGALFGVAPGWPFVMAAGLGATALLLLPRNKAEANQP